MIVTTQMGVSHTDDMGVAMVGDLIASMVLMALNLFYTRDKIKSPDGLFNKRPKGDWCLAAFFLFLSQLLVGLVFFLLIRLIAYLIAR